MDELALAKWSMNRAVREELEARPIFDPASLDAPPRPLPPDWEMSLDEALEPDDGRLGVTGGGLGPWAPWEVIP